MWKTLWNGKKALKIGKVFTTFLIVLFCGIGISILYGSTPELIEARIDAFVKLVNTMFPYFAFPLAGVAGGGVATKIIAMFKEKQEGDDCK